MTDPEFILCKWKRRLWPAKVRRNEEMFVEVAWKRLRQSRKEGRGPRNCLSLSELWRGQQEKWRGGPGMMGWGGY